MNHEEKELECAQLIQHINPSEHDAGNQRVLVIRLVAFDDK